MEKRKMKNAIMIIIMIVCLGLTLISTYKIINWYIDVNANEKIKEEVNKNVEKKEDTYEIDFKKLKSQNQDVVGYLKVNNTNIDYIVVKGTNNDYYLHHDFKKNSNVAGWVFANYQNKFDGTDKNIVIFGHNMRDGSMFGSLKNVLKKSWYENGSNLKVGLITEDGTFTYEVFSVYQIEAEDYYIQTAFNNDREYSNFLQTITDRSIKSFKTKVGKDDKILTLSTCSMTGKERVVLHAKKI